MIGAGGGGGTFLAGFLSWFVSDPLLTLSSLAVILIAFYMMRHRVDPGHIVMTCAGIWTAFNYQTVLGFLH